MEMFNKIKSAVSGALPGNPLSKDFDVHNHEAAVFVFEKKQLERYSRRDKELILESMKKGVSQLTRLRHPKVLSVLSPLEESREMLAYATEPVFASLANVLGSLDNMPSPIPKYIQDYKLYEITEGLGFLHNDVKLMHSNICPESIIINKNGSWKLAGFDFCIPNANTHDQSPLFPFREWDPEIPPVAQPNLNYLAPEYALTMSCSQAKPTVRPDPNQLCKRDNLQKSQFFKGLPKIISKLPKRVNLQRILPPMLKESVNPDMIPFLLPSILLIAEQSTDQEYTTVILPALKPMFVIKEPIQVLLIFMQNMNLLLKKTPQADIRNHVLPMIHQALESDSPQLQEICMNIIPTFAELVEFSSLRNSIVPRIKKLCLSTSTLTIRVNCLLCLGKLLEFMDKWSVIDDVLPLLPQIPSREPAVLMSILGIYQVTMTHPKLGLTKDMIANKVLPFIIPLSIDNNLNLPQTEHHSKLEQTIEITKMTASDDKQLIGAVDEGPKTMMDKFLSGFGISNMIGSGAKAGSQNLNPVPAATGGGDTSLSLEEKQRLAKQQEQQRVFKSQKPLNVSSSTMTSQSTSATSASSASKAPVKDLTSSLMNSNIMGLQTSSNRSLNNMSSASMGRGGNSFGMSSSASTGPSSYNVGGQTSSMGMSGGFSGGSSSMGQSSMGYSSGGMMGQNSMMSGGGQSSPMQYNQTSKQKVDLSAFDSLMSGSSSSQNKMSLNQMSQQNVQNRPTGTGSMGFMGNPGNMGMMGNMGMGQNTMMNMSGGMRPNQMMGSSGIGQYNQGHVQNPMGMQSGAPQMSISVEKLLNDAQVLVARFRKHDTTADILISTTQSLHKRLDAMKQYQDDITELNEIARHRPRSTLVLGIAQENRQIRELQQENRELQLSLEEHQSALELIMQKYREQIMKLIQSNKYEKALAVKQDQSKDLEVLIDKISEMAAVMQKAIAVDDKAAAKDHEQITKLTVENQGLRELLEVCSTAKQRILDTMNVEQDEKGCQTDVVEEPQPPPEQPEQSKPEKKSTTGGSKQSGSTQSKSDSRSSTPSKSDSSTKLSSTSPTKSDSSTKQSVTMQILQHNLVITKQSHFHSYLINMNQLIQVSQLSKKNMNQLIQVSQLSNIYDSEAAVFVFEKKQLERYSRRDKELILESMKKGVSQLTRLRHPKVLSVLSPLEESREMLAYATEPVFASLANVLGSLDNMPSPIPKYIQDYKLYEITEGLGFLHNDVKLMHSNICPESIIINKNGSWKLAGFDFFIPNANTHDQSRDNLQKSQFFKGLPKIISKLPKRVNLQRILPPMLKESVNPDMIPFLLPSILLIAEQSTDQEYTTVILPALKPMFVIKEPIQVLLIFMQNMNLLLKKTPQADIRNHVLPMIHQALESDSPQLQPLLLRGVLVKIIAIHICSIIIFTIIIFHVFSLQEICMNIIPTFAELVEFSSLRNSIVPRIKKLCLSTSTLTIRVNCLLCLGKLLEFMDKWSVIDDVLPLLPQIPSREPAVLMSILGIYQVTMTHPKLGLTKDMIANKVLPFIIPLSIDNNLNLPQTSLTLEEKQRLAKQQEQQRVFKSQKPLNVSSSSMTSQSTSATSASSAPVKDLTSSLMNSNMMGLQTSSNRSLNNVSSASMGRGGNSFGMSSSASTGPSSYNVGGQTSSMGVSGGFSGGSSSMGQSSMGYSSGGMMGQNSMMSGGGQSSPMQYNQTSKQKVDLSAFDSLMPGSSSSQNKMSLNQMSQQNIQNRPTGTGSIGFMGNPGNMGMMGNMGMGQNTMMNMSGGMRPNQMMGSSGIGQYNQGHMQNPMGMQSGAPQFGGMNFQQQQAQRMNQQTSNQNSSNNDIADIFG
ncbi:hypothetical protein KUTeg_023691 [Tegillarca granosa]|uniref:Protein kinase domain-containing protein n=1 Tax=Tegillarca granosa TaxID=220873 RepID=A0ABQ9E2E2_TEGGR|nr:hypothetical protein KUTeg_023691 [Tegillarca granosa]